MLKIFMIFSMTLALVAVSLPESASAWSVSGFRCRDSGSKIKCAINVTGAKGRKCYFDVDLEPDDGRVRYRRSASVRLRYNDSRVSFGFEDMFSAELWWVRGTVQIGDRVKRTGWKALRIE